MVIYKLILKAYKKADKVFFYNFFFLYIKILTRYYKKTKKNFQKRLVKDTEIFLKKKNKRSVNMVINDIKNLQKIKNKGQLIIQIIIL